jgi:hypothetical protein
MMLVTFIQMFSLITTLITILNPWTWMLDAKFNRGLLSELKREYLGETVQLRSTERPSDWDKIMLS